MAKKLAVRGTQYPVTAEFIFNYNDWVTDSGSGVKYTFGAAVTNTGTATAVDPGTGIVEPGLTSGTGLTFDCIPMPLGAYITGAEVNVETAYVGIGAGATLSLGIAGSTTALVNAADLDAAAAGAKLTIATFTPTLSNSGQNIRLTLAGLTAAASAGRVRVRVNYTIDGKVNEVSAV